jgi:catechol 2,3-dioxygenase-like lactoylglutathione lyase family enzyme
LRSHGNGRSECSRTFVIVAPVFDHVTIRASDREASERFYTLVLGTIGIEPTHSDDHFAQWADFSLAAAASEKPATGRLHIAFVAQSRRNVDEFWRVATVAGYRDNGPPGERPAYHACYYGAFVLDPDGNNVELVNHIRRR